MKPHCEFKDTTFEDIEEMMRLINDNRFLPHMTFLLNWTEGKDNVGGMHLSVLDWMRYYKARKDIY